MVAVRRSGALGPAGLGLLALVLAATAEGARAQGGGATGATDAVPLTAPIEPVAFPFAAPGEPVAFPFAAPGEPVAFPFAAPGEPVAVSTAVPLRFVASSIAAPRPPVALLLAAPRQPVAVPLAASIERAAVPLAASLGGAAVPLAASLQFVALPGGSAQEPPPVGAAERGQGGEAPAAVPVPIPGPAPHDLGPFVPEEWQRLLVTPDLDARERAYAALLERLPHWHEARSWVARQGRESRGELAWTCRLLLRELDAGGLRLLPPGLGPRDLVLELDSGVVGRAVVVGGEAAEGPRGWFVTVAPRADGTDLGAPGGQVPVVEWIVDPAAADLVPAPPWARRVELHFEWGAETPGPDPSAAPGTRLEELIEQSYRLRLPSGSRSPGRAADPAPRPATLERLGVLVVTARRGLEVRDVEPGSAAHLLGVAPGDRLLAIDAVTLERPEQISERLQVARERGQVRVRWRRAADGEVVERRFVVPGALRPQAPGAAAGGSAPKDPGTEPSRSEPSRSVPSRSVPSRTEGPPDGGR